MLHRNCGPAQIPTLRNRLLKSSGSVALSDGISSLSFSPKANYLVATSWDNQAMQRSTQIPCSIFNHDGTNFAYAVSYDWGKGAENHTPAQARNFILLHPTQDSEVEQQTVSYGLL